MSDDNPLMQLLGGIGPDERTIDEKKRDRALIVERDCIQVAMRSATEWAVRHISDPARLGAALDTAYAAFYEHCRVRHLGIEETIKRINEENSQ